MQSHYFKRFKRECEHISPHIKFKKIKHGFYRIYWKHIYLYECSENMPYRGYSIEIENPMVNESKRFYEEYEENIEMIKIMKNFVEGYSESIDHVRRRVWLHRHDREFNKFNEDVVRNYAHHG